MTRALFFRPLALAAALAALGAAGPAHAMSDWQRECQRGTYEINPYTPCAQPFHEGLAAAINRVPRVSPEPLIAPKAKSKPLTPETRQVIEDGGAEVAVGGVGEPEL